MRKSKNPEAKFINYSQGKNLKVRLRGKRLINGNISLFLDYYQGYNKDAEGDLKTKRKLEYLKIYLAENPRTPDERRVNEENLTLAQLIRSNRESDLQHSTEGLIAPYRKKTNFFDYCQSYLDRYQKKDIRMVKTAITQFKLYTGESFLTPLQIDMPKIRGFRDHLINSYNGETPNSIFARFKKILNAATEERLFMKNPAAGITCPIPDGIPKEILTQEEVIKIASAKCGNPETKRAFLLCVLTGLRFCDVKTLQYKHITNGLIMKRQQKVGRQVTINLTPAALNLIGEMGDPEDYVFTLPSFEACLSTIKNWAKRGGVNKKITWHSARHSFATLLLMNNTDIKTVQSLLGHSKVEHTQKYTHVVDELKAKAVGKLPQIEI